MCHTEEGFPSSPDWEVSHWLRYSNVDPYVPDVYGFCKFSCGFSIRGKYAGCVSVVGFCVDDLNRIVQAITHDDGSYGPKYFLASNAHVWEGIGEDTGTDKVPVEVFRHVSFPSVDDEVSSLSYSLLDVSKNPFLRRLSAYRSHLC